MKLKICYLNFWGKFDGLIKNNKICEIGVKMFFILNNLLKNNSIYKEKEIYILMFFKNLK